MFKQTLLPSSLNGILQFSSEDVVDELFLCTRATKKEFVRNRLKVVDSINIRKSKTFQGIVITVEIEDREKISELVSFEEEFWKNVYKLSKNFYPKQLRIELNESDCARIVTALQYWLAKLENVHFKCGDRETDQNLNMLDPYFDVISSAGPVSQISLNVRSHKHIIITCGENGSLFKYSVTTPSLLTMKHFYLQLNKLELYSYSCISIIIISNRNADELVQQCYANRGLRTIFDTENRFLIEQRGRTIKMNVGEFLGPHMVLLMCLLLLLCLPFLIFFMVFVSTTYPLILGILTMSLLLSVFLKDLKYLPYFLLIPEERI